MSVGIARDLVGMYEISELNMSDSKKNKVFTIRTQTGEFIGGIYQQNRLYDWLKNQGIDYSKYNSKKWMPDEAFINERNKTLYIVEKNSKLHQDLWMKKFLDFLINVAFIREW